MDKDIILITAYCPDSNKVDKLRTLINQLQVVKNKFDVMVVSHTTIPLDIQDKVNLCLYDKKNELLTDWDLINQPWFSPGNGRRIQSGLLTGRNTHLAIWRMFISSFSLCKNLGYNKIHHIEYDCEIEDFSEIVDNSKLLNEYDFIYYKDTKENVDDILFGSFQSYNLNSLPNELINLNEEEIKNKIRSASSKSPERMLEDILKSNGKVKVKNRSDLERNGNKFGTSEDDDTFNPWGVPYIDLETERLQFIVWNTKKQNGVEYTIIVNDNNVIKIPNTLHDHWKIVDIENIQNVNKLIVLEDNKIRHNIKFDSDMDRELFKKISFRFK